MISTNSFQRGWRGGGAGDWYKGCDRGWASRADGQEKGRGVNNNMPNYA